MESNDSNLSCFLKVPQSCGKMLIEKWRKESWPSIPGVDSIYMQGFLEISQVHLLFQLVVFITDDSTQALQEPGLCPFPGCSPSTCPHIQGLTPWDCL